MPPNWLPLAGLGIAALAAFLFWEAVQHWIADLIQRTAERFKNLAYALQTALVIFDKIMVNGQRVIAALARLIYFDPQTNTTVQVEEMRPVKREDLPVEVRAKLERGEAVEYQIRKQ